MTFLEQRISYSEQHGAAHGVLALAERMVHAPTSASPVPAAS